MFFLLAVTGGRVIAQDVEQLPGFYTSISKVETITDSTFVVTAAVITHPTQAYDGTDIQLGDILYSRPVIVGDDCNRFAIDSIIYKFAGTIKVRVIEQQDNGQPATGINAFIRENSRGQAHWISDIGSPLNQCISGRLSARAQDYSWYAKDSLGNVVEVLDGDTVLLSSGGLLVNTDNQFVDSLAIAGGLLQISLSGSDSVAAVDLSAYLDNTDAQNLTNSGKTGTSQSISISNGNTISFSIADSDSSGTNELINAVNLVGTVLQITDAGGTKTQDLASLQDGTGTDDQQITAFSITNDTLTITLEDGGSLSVDLSGYLDNTDTVNDADSVVGNELQTLIDGGSSGNNRTIGLSDGGGNVTFSVADTDADSTNELNASLRIIGDSLKITDAGGVLAVSLAKYLDNRDTDRQGFNLTSINATTKQIGLDSTTSYFRLSAGDNITLDLVDSTITINAQTISVIDSATFANDSLTLYFGSDSIQVYLGFEFTDTNTDKQQIDSFFIDNDTIYLSIERDSTEALKIGLNKYLDNTDSQQLGVGKVGNIYTVTLDSSSSIQIDVTDADNDSANEFNTGLNLVGTTLQITDGGGTLTQDLSSLQDGIGLDTSGYNKQFTITDDSLIITDGQTRLAVDLSVYRDSALGVDLVNDADSVIGNEIQTLLDNGRNGQDQSLLLTLGGGIVTFSVADNDADTTNELNTNLFISGDTLYIVDAGGSYAVDLSPYLDDTDTDEQGFVLSTISTTTEKIGLERTSTAVYLKEGDNIGLQRSGETITISANVDAIFDTIYFDSLLYLVVDGDTTTVPIKINERADTSGYNYSFTRAGDSLFIQDGQNTLSVYAPIGSGVDRADTSGYNLSLTRVGDSIFIQDGNGTLSVYAPIGGGGISLPIDSLTFTDNQHEVLEGELQYDSEKGFLKYGGVDNVELLSNQDVIWLVKNQTGSPIPKGTAVMAVGADGNSGKILVAPMDASNLNYQELILGVTKNLIQNDTTGYVVERGKISGLDLTQFTNGDILYNNPDSAGGLVATQPLTGNLKQPIGFVVSDKSNGVLAVRLKTGEQLGQLHDVKVNGTLAAGNVIVYDGSIWKNQIQLDSQLLSFDTLTSVLSISNGNSVDLSTIGGDTTFISNITQIIGDTAQQGTRIDTIVINTIGGDTTIYIETDTNDVLYTGANGITISGTEIQLGGTMKKPWTTFIGQSGNENMVFGNMNNLYFDNENNYIAGQNSTYIVADNQIRFAPLTGSNYSVNLNNGSESTASFTNGIRFTGSQFAIQSMDFYLSGLTIDSALATDYVLTMDGTQIVKKSLESDIDNQKLTVGSLTGENQIPLTIENGNQVFIPIADPDADATNEIQTLSWSAGTGGNDVITLSDGGGSITITDNVNDADASTTNEKITDVSLVGTTLNITEGGVLISENLAGLQDGTGTDDQKIDQFQIISNSIYLSLEGDGEAAKTVSLAPYLDNTDDQTATEVPFTPTGTISSTNVQAAIAELDGDISGIGGGFGTVGTNEIAFGSGDSLTSSSDLTYSGNTLTMDGRLNLDDGTNTIISSNSSTTIDASANFNISLGSNLRDLTTGDENIAIGLGALDDITTGSNNLAIGVASLFKLSGNSNFNIGIGRDALANTTSANRNTAIGVSALLLNTTGSDNTALGFQAARNMTSAKKSTIIGAGSSLLNAADSNSIVIGYNATGFGSNTAAIGSNLTTQTRLFGDLYTNGALFDSTGSSGTAGQVLISNGSNAWSWGTASGGGEFGTVGNNQLAYGSADTLTSSSSLTWNNTNKTLAINENLPFGMLSIQQNGTTDLLRFQDESGNQLMTVDEIGRLYLYPNGGQDNTTSVQITHSSGDPQIAMVTDGGNAMTIAQRDGSLGLPNRLTFIHTGDSDKNLTYFQGGKLGVNVGSDITQEFDVNGDARLRGALFDSTNSSGTAGQVLTSNGGNAWSWEDASGGGGTPTLTATYVGFGDGSNELTGESALIWDATNNRLGINTASPTRAIQVESGDFGQISIRSTATNRYAGFQLVNGDGLVANVAFTGSTSSVPNAVTLAAANTSTTVGFTIGPSSKFLSTNTKNVSNVKLELEADLIDEDGSAGTAGQVLGVGVTGVEWQNPTDIGIAEYTDVAQDGSLGATETLDMEGIASKIFEFEVGGTSSTTLSFSNPVNGGMYICRLYGATGTTTVNFPANFKFASGSAVTSVSFLSSYIFKYYYNGTDYITY